MWVVRAGRDGRWADAFIADGVVGLGWHEVGDSTRFASKAALTAALQTVYPNWKEGTALSGASQLWRFQKDVRIGDPVATYDGGSRLYYVGTIAGPSVYEPGAIEELTLRRKVAWASVQVSRDALSDDARNRLGSALTLFRIPETTALELARLSGTAATAAPKPEVQLVADEAPDLFADIAGEAALRIADRISVLGPEQMELLVAALLRAMGYKTEISPRGPDRGRDVVASPDGFGFQQPRIVVEVKHRQGKIDAPNIRAFLGGRHRDDRGLYVSTGGFTREALL